MLHSFALKHFDPDIAPEADVPDGTPRPWRARHWSALVGLVLMSFIVNARGNDLGAPTYEGYLGSSTPTIAAMVT